MEKGTEITGIKRIISKNRKLGILKFILFSGIGIVMFFVNVNIGGVSVIPIQHIINFIKKVCAPVIPYYALVMVINDLYKKGVYSARESVIISTGFSTVAISFLIVIANTLGLMDHWTLYFFASFFVTFLVTAITARIYPIAKIPDSYYVKKAESTLNYKEKLFKRAYNAGVEQACSAKPLSHYLKVYYLVDAIKMSSAVTASILAIGLLGIVIAEYTPLFDLPGYVYYPFTLLLQIPEPLLAAKASAVEIAEMFLPAMLVVNSHIITKFTIAVTSVSAILFFSASIPCLLSTDIPVKMRDLMIIWFERTVLSLVFAAAIGHLLF